MCGLDDNINPHESSNVDGTTASQENIAFSAEEEKLYSRKFRNGYDLYDPRYTQWFSVHHPIVACRRSNEQARTLILTCSKARNIHSVVLANPWPLEGALPLEIANNFSYDLSKPFVVRSLLPWLVVLAQEIV